MQKGFAPILILVIIAVLALGGFWYYQMKDKASPYPSQQNTQTSTNSQDSPVPTDTDETIPILKDYDPESFGRNLWLYSADLKQSKQLTFNHEISGLYSKSPDNKKILVSTINRVPADNNVHEKISIIDVGTKNITKIFASNNETSGISSVSWLDNNRIIYSLGRQIKIYTISSGSEEILTDANKSITDATRIIFGLSPDKKWLVYFYSGNGEGDPPQQDTNTYSINMESKKQARLFSDNYYYVLNNNSIIYRKTVNEKAQIWKTDFSGSKEELITTLSQGELINVTSNDSGTRIIYQVRNYSSNSGYAELYLYNLDTKTSQMIFKSDVGDGIRAPRMSPNGDSVLFSAAFDKNNPIKFTIVSLDLLTNKQSTLTNESEHSSSTVIMY